VPVSDFELVDPQRPQFAADRRPISFLADNPPKGCARSGISDSPDPCPRAPTALSEECGSGLVNHASNPSGPVIRLRHPYTEGSLRVHRNSAAPAPGLDSRIHPDFSPLKCEILVLDHLAGLGGRRRFWASVVRQTAAISSHLSVAHD